MFRSYPPQIVLEAVLNGLLTGAVYALVALGLTLVYGVLHIINFAHGAMLTLAMFAVLVVHLGIPDRSLSRHPSFSCRCSSALAISSSASS